MKTLFVFCKLQARIVSAFATLLFMVLLAVLIMVNSIISHSAHQEIEKNLTISQHLFNFINDEHNQKLVQTANILSSDFAFREAVATADRETLISVLDNYRTRFNANAMFLANLNQQMIADTMGLTKAREAFPLPDILVTAQQTGQATTMTLLNHRLYQIVIVPVLAPEPIAWLATAFLIDDKYAHTMQALMGLELSFLARQKATGQWQLLASSLPTTQAAHLPTVLLNTQMSADNDAIKLQLGDVDYLAHLLTLAVTADSSTVAVLQRSFREVLKPLREVQQIILLLSGVSFLLALIASTRIARSITTPIRSLADMAERVRYGDYSQHLTVTSKDEIGQLAAAFRHMRAGIADRESKIMILANHDSLTGLPNRTLFHDRLDQAIKSAKRGGRLVTVMLTDLNRFKEVNDIMGHHIGDLLLQEIAKRLQSIVSNDYDTVARLGGDEFAILLAIDLEAAKIIANELLTIIDEPIFLEGQEVIVSTSIGIACYPEHGDELNTLLRYADLAMYSAKHNNLGYVIFDVSLDAQDQQHLSLMAELRHAVLQDELTVYYQPKLELATGVITHAEALIRWIHPERGLVPPSEFIPFAENTGFIRTITLWIIEHVICQQRELQQAGIAITISINVSAHDLFIPKLPALLSDLLAKYDVSAACLILEITESAIMSDPQSALCILNDIYDRGLRLSIDDFGTGYSSLAYLKKLPVSELKIDQSFVCNMANDNDDAMIVRATIDLAHNMGLKVVAEGVENTESWNMLQAMGCDFLQGYYISRPLPMPALLEWIETSPWQLNNVSSDEKT